MDAQLDFRRHEKKYLLTPAQYETVLARLAPRMTPDCYGESTVLSLYYDTPDYALVRASLERPVYKEKLRLRAYGVPGPDDQTFVEIKKKYEGIVYKRRVALPLHEARDYLADRWHPADSQTVRELDFFQRRYQGLRPAALLCYDRTALSGAEDAALRVTFDRNVRGRCVQLDLARGDWGNPILPPETVLMELKLPESAPLWLARLLSEAGVHPAQFSKYGTYYQQALAPQRRVNIRKDVFTCA